MEVARRDQLEEEERRELRAGFAAEVLELGAVLELFAPCTDSSLGRRMLEELTPRDEEDARAALARVDEALLLRKAGDLPGMGGVTDPLPPGMDGQLDEERLVALRGFLDAAARMAEWFPSRVQDTPELCAVVSGLPDLSGLATELDRVLDERGRIRRDATPLLARLARDIQQVSSQVEGRLRELMQRGDIRTVLSDGSVHRRGGRPVLAVRAKSSGKVKGIVHDRSQSDQTVFIEPTAVIELGNRLAELRADEKREIDRILFELSFPDEAQAKIAMNKAIQKLPIRARIITRDEEI